jgi:hypothetical protein
LRSTCRSGAVARATRSAGRSASTAADPLSNGKARARRAKSLKEWSRRQESNLRPSDYKSDALPTELHRPCHDSGLQSAAAADEVTAPHHATDVCGHQVPDTTKYRNQNLRRPTSRDDYRLFAPTPASRVTGPRPASRSALDRGPPWIATGRWHGPREDGRVSVLAHASVRRRRRPCGRLRAVTLLSGTRKRGGVLVFHACS